MFIKNNLTKKGFALIEVLIAVTIASGAMIVIVASANKSLLFARTTLNNYQANLAIEESVEAVKAIRASGWTNISTLESGELYGINWSGTNWQISASPVTTDLGFTREIIFSDVYRDGNDDIAPAGTLDEGIKKVTITVTWMDRTQSKSQTVEMYIADIL